MLLAACQPGGHRQAAAGPVLSAADRAELRWPVIPGFAGTACNLVPPAAINKALPPVHHDSSPGGVIVDNVNLFKGIDGGGNAECDEGWNARSQRFVIDFVAHGNQASSYEASDLQPHDYPAGLPSELYASFQSGSGRVTTVTVPYKGGYLELSGNASLDVAQLTRLLGIALIRAPKFAPA